MKSFSRLFRCGVVCVMFCMFISAKLFGCVRSMASVKVPTNFRVSVWNDTKPAPGVAIEIYKDEPSVAGVKPTPVLTLQTDQNGSAEVKYLAPGVYVVATTGPGQGSAAYAVVATNHSKPSSEIKLEWPSSWESLRVRALAGDLITNKPRSPFENIHLELWTAGVPRPLAVADTGPEGHFHFDESTPGIYILRVRGLQKDIAPDDQIQGDITIELSPSDPAATGISLRLDVTDCGITYSNCPFNAKPVAMASRRIQVLNVPGTAEFPTINGAEYKLLNDHGVSIAEGTTDKNGIAQLPTEATGRTTLIVASPLMTTFQLPLDLLTPVAAAPDLAITLKQLDECSTASLEINAP
jgi:hypothetical protein